jgi:predicted membrane protein
MRNQAQITFGGLLIFFGLLALIGVLFDVDFGTIFVPVLLILIGLLIIFRPRMLPSGAGMQLRFLGDVYRKGAWQVKEEEYWSFVGSVRLDMTEAEIPTGETSFRIYNFVGDVSLTVPEGVGVSVSNMTFVTDARLMGKKYGGILTPQDWSTEGYETAERKIRLDRVGFVGNLRVRRS